MYFDRIRQRAPISERWNFVSIEPNKRCNQLLFMVHMWKVWFNKKIKPEKKTKPGIENIFIANRIVRRKHWSGISLSSHHYGREAEREFFFFFFGVAEWQQNHIHKYIDDCMGKEMKKGKKFCSVCPPEKQNTNHQCIHTKYKHKVHTYLDLLDTEIIDVCWFGIVWRKTGIFVQVHLNCSM